MVKMKILIGNHHLQFLGGSETFTYTLAVELLRLGHSVYYYTFFRGLISEKMEAEGAVFYDLKNKNREKFDIALLSHQTIFRYKIKARVVVQTCHGVNHPYEQPSVYADRIVAVSEKIGERLLEKKYSSTIIRNGIDCQRFSPRIPLNNKLKNVLSLCQSQTVNDLIKNACDKINVQFYAYAKTARAVWDIERVINEVDLVVSLGRGVCEAMACGRNVFVYDHRVSCKPHGEGMITPENASLLATHNFSGSYYKNEYTLDSIIAEMKKYTPEWGAANRDFILENHDIKKTVQHYLSLLPLSKKERQIKFFRIMRQYISNMRYNYRVICFKEYDGYYKVINGRKKEIVDENIFLKINQGKIKPILFEKLDFHKFEISH